MLYRKNITRPESLLRIAGGLALIAAALWWQGASPWGWHWPQAASAAS